MFKNLFKLEYKRTGLEAVGFYIVYLIMLVLILSLINGVVTNVIFYQSNHSGNAISFQEVVRQGYEQGQQVAMQITPILWLLSSAMISIGILVRKKNYTIGSILLALVAICMTELFGLILGMIPMAILTTFDNKRLQE